MSIINSDYVIGNRTGNLPACSAVAQPAVPPRAASRRVQSFSFVSAYRTTMAVVLTELHFPPSFRTLIAKASVSNQS
jgi:hypothetical protein